MGLTAAPPPGDELLTLATCDLAGIVRGRSVPVADRERRLETGVGWVPANQAITAFGDLAEPNPWGSVGDVRLLPDPATEWRVDRWPGIPPLHVVLCDIVETDGSPWDACARTFLRDALARLHDETGLRLHVAFEHEFALCADGPAAPAFSLAAQRMAEPFAGRAMAALREAGAEPELFLPEYGAHQFELPVAPCEGVAAADRALVVREVVREVARREGLRASFAPLQDPGAVGAGAHVHLGLVGEDGTAVSYDAGRPAQLSRTAGSFAAGVLRHLPALLALTAPSPHSYLRLQPHRWSAALPVVGERDREAVLRVCPTTTLGGGDPASQLHLEFRAADATASPYLVLGGLVHAGLAGLREGLEPPLAGPAPPPSLAAALDALEDDPIGLPPLLLEAYVALKRCELAGVAGLDQEEVCRRYAGVH